MEKVRMMRLIGSGGLLARPPGRSNSPRHESLLDHAQDGIRAAGTALAVACQAAGRRHMERNRNWLEKPLNGVSCI
jgi:hypothetical protein